MAKFSLGAQVITANAFEKIPHELIAACLSKHAEGDWGQSYSEDAAANDRGLVEGQEDRLMSVWSDPSSGQKFWIITEWDRSVTTVLLPEDY